MKTGAFLITLNVPPGLEEAMVDCLLTFEFEHGFTSFPVSAHDHDYKTQKLSNIEQVVGRQRKIRFQLYLEADEVTLLLSKLKNEFSHAGIRYWLMPVLERGVI